MRITKAQFRGLDQYKYSGIDKSVLSRHVLTPWWNWLVTCFPRSLAPNAVSMSLMGEVGMWAVGVGAVSSRCSRCSPRSLAARANPSPLYSPILPTNPSQITFIGLSFVFANVLTLFYFDPKYEGLDLPTWVYFSWSFGLFAYQSEYFRIYSNRKLMS
jgi:ethanolaminephosphotransferase